MGGSVAVVYRPDNNAGEEVQVTFIADKHENAFILIDQSDLTVHSFGQDQNGALCSSFSWRHTGDWHSSQRRPHTVCPPPSCFPLQAP